MQGLVGAIGANVLRSHGEYASGHLAKVFVAFLGFKQYDTHMEFIGKEIWGWVGTGAAMSSRSSRHGFPGNCRQQHAAHLSKYIGISSNILMHILQRSTETIRATS